VLQLVDSSSSKLELRQYSREGPGFESTHSTLLLQLYFLTSGSHLTHLMKAIHHIKGLYHLVLDSS
jgi:hypothetical protein